MKTCSHRLCMSMHHLLYKIMINENMQPQAMHEYASRTIQDNDQ